MVAKLSGTSTSGIHGDQWQILARSFKGKAATADLDSHESIQNLKYEIYLKDGIPQELITVLHTGKLLNDNHSREEAGLHPGRVQCLIEDP